MHPSTSKTRLGQHGVEEEEGRPTCVGGAITALFSSGSLLLPSSEKQFSYAVAEPWWETGGIEKESERYSIPSSFRISTTWSRRSVLADCCAGAKMETRRWWSSRERAQVSGRGDDDQGDGKERTLTGRHGASSTTRAHTGVGDRTGDERLDRRKTTRMEGTIPASVGSPSRTTSEPSTTTTTSTTSSTSSTKEEQERWEKKWTNRYAEYMGYSRKAFFKKVHNPRATKPWQNRKAVTSGAIFVTAQDDMSGMVERIHTPPRGGGGDQEGSEPFFDEERSDRASSSTATAGFVHHMGHLTTRGVMGMRSAHLPVTAAQQGFLQSLTAEEEALRKEDRLGLPEKEKGRREEEEEKGEERTDLQVDGDDEEAHHHERWGTEKEWKNSPSRRVASVAGDVWDVGEETSIPSSQEERQEWARDKDTASVSSRRGTSISTTTTTTSTITTKGAASLSLSPLDRLLREKQKSKTVEGLYPSDAAVASPWRGPSISSASLSTTSFSPSSWTVQAPDTSRRIPISASLSWEVDHVDTYLPEKGGIGGEEAAAAGAPTGGEDGSIPLSLQAHALRRDNERRHDSTAPWNTLSGTSSWNADPSLAEEGSAQTSVSSSTSTALSETTDPAARMASKRELANAIRLPRNLNKLFHKIMGWSEELEQVHQENAAIGKREGEGEKRGVPSLSSVDGELSQASLSRAEERRQVKQQLQAHTDRMKYGVLLADYEKDQFALTHQLAIAGNKLERKFLHWEGMHILDQDATEPMAFVREHKAAMILQTPSSAAIPVLHRDCCSGCGALLQDTDKDNFGYVKPGEIERYLAQRERIAEAKAEYATRMAELQRHWGTHGRQVGEEWLDFMTQEEFDAFYRYRPAPFFCRRCHCLEHLGVEGRRKVWSAPDFTEQLRSLQEKKCLVVLVVDITDFPGSMVYDLPGMISMNNPVVIVANKMDCVRNRSFCYTHKDKAVSSALVSERYIKRWVMDIATAYRLPKEQIKAVIPLSAKRGWNVDGLLEAIEEHSNLNLRRPHPPRPTYFVGAANVGKSSVINAIAHHLYVPQPPHPESKKVYYTMVNRKTGEESIHWRWYTPPNVNRAEMVDIPSRHDKKSSKLLTVSSLPGTTVAVNGVRLALPGTQSRRHHGQGTRNENDHHHKKKEHTEEGGAVSCWLYDTPGVLPHWHPSSPLTLLQMRRLLQRKFRHPECYLLVPGNTLLLAGLAAVDVVKGCTKGMLFMVYTSAKAQHAIVQTSQADLFWSMALGKRIGPPDSYEQLLAHQESLEFTETDSDGHLPASHRHTSSGSGSGGGSSSTSPGQKCLLSVSKSYLFECYPRHRRRPVADIYICGLGWISFCVREPTDVVLRVRTLPGVLHGVRRPLRYNDLRSFKSWPKLRRASTHKAIGEEEKLKERAKSITTVVKMVAGTPVRDVNDVSSGKEGKPQEDHVSRGTREESHRHASSTSFPEASARTGEAGGRSGRVESEEDLSPAPRTSPHSSWTSSGEKSRDGASTSLVLPSALANSTVQMVEKAPLPHFESGSSTPFTDLLEDLSRSSAV